ncbi:MAG: cyclic nucleotide-binding/CBS domain-containing protein [Nitrospirae bacterium]|nr:cyclic nucleotide-binding/CBS domain-containing protein [Nitrospirota bacterium]
MIIDEILSFFQQTPPFQFLTEQEQKKIAQNLSMEFYPKETVILRQGGSSSDSLRIIKKGGVRISIVSESGEDVAIDYRGEGEAFGMISLMGDKQKTTVTSVEDTICYLLGKQEFMKLMDSSPAFIEYFLQSHFSKYIDKTYTEMRNKSLFYGSSDHILFTTQVGEIAEKEVVTIDETATIQDAAQVMSDRRISSLVVVQDDDVPVGIVTDRDLRDKVVSRGRNINDPVRDIMSPPLIRVDSKDYCFEAVLKMLKHNIHHVLVIRDGKLSGVITNHDLMLLQGKSPLSFAKDIENQHTIEGLVPVSKKINNIIGFLLKEGAKASNITKIITELNDRLVRKIIEIAEKQFGSAPLSYCWIAFGSEGRKEQTFRTDQDNAIIYANPASDEDHKSAAEYFARLAEFMKESLLKCGFPPCPAGYMASNPQWTQPINGWKKYFSTWVSAPTSEAVLKSLIFFDFRPIHGDFALADELKETLNIQLSRQKLLLGHLANMIVKNTSPVGFLKSFVVEKSGEHKNQLNLKIKGVTLIVDIVRLFALERGIKETSTLERIDALRNKHTIVKEYAEELEHAFEFIMLLRMHNQLAQLEKGEEINNFIDPDTLSNLEKKTMKDSFHLISKIQDMIIERYKPFII